MKKVAISQSNYIPWKGYFDMIAAVDKFVLYDDVQFTRRDWRNRNKVKTPQGLKWLTIPVVVKGKYFQKIRDTKLSEPDWGAKHWKTIESNYKKSPHYEWVATALEPLYLKTDWDSLSDVNRAFIERICGLLDINTEISSSSDYHLEEGPTERLLGIVEQIGGDCYVSGPAAQNYMKTEIFDEKNIEIEWFDYSGYPEYPQLWGEFEHGVSIIDLLFNVGPRAPEMMKHVTGA